MPATAFIESVFPPMMPVDPAGNSLLRCSTRTKAAPGAVAGVLPIGVAGLGADAGDIVVRTLVFERRLGLGAFWNGAGASRMKSASGRRIECARNRARNRLQAMVPVAVDAGNRFEQAARVRVERISEQLRGGRLLHHACCVEDRHVVGVLGDDSKIVRDENYGEAEADLQLADQIENLRLDGDVERGGRLVGD